MNISSTLIDIYAAEILFNLLIHCLIATAISWFSIKLLKKQSAPFRSTIILITLTVTLLLPFTMPLLDNFSGDSAVTIQTFTISVQSNPNVLSQKASVLSTEDLLFLIWICGSLFMLTRLTIGLFSVSKLINSATPVLSESTDRILKQSLNKFMDLNFKGIYTSSQIKSPVIAGFRAPLIIIPETLLLNSGDEELTAIIDHELSHIYHKDQITGLIQRLVASIYWWNPFIHLMNRELSNLREYVADNYAISTSSPVSYAKSLTTLTEKSLISDKRIPGLLSFSSSTVSMKARIMEVVKKGRRMETSVNGGVFLSTLLLIITSSVALASHRIEVHSNPVKDLPSSPIPSYSAAELKKKLSYQTPEKVSYIKRPKLYRKVAPVYPKDALKLRVAGSVLLEVTTNIYGQVREIRVISSANKLLNSASIDAVKQWKYEPYIINGKPHPIKFTVNVTYSLHSDKAYKASKKLKKK